MAVSSPFGLLPVFGDELWFVYLVSEREMSMQLPPQQYTCTSTSRRAASDGKTL